MSLDETAPNSQMGVFWTDEGLAMVMVDRETKQPMTGEGAVIMPYSQALALYDHLSLNLADLMAKADEEVMDLE